MVKRRDSAGVRGSLCSARLEILEARVLYSADWLPVVVDDDVAPAKQSESHQGLSFPDPLALLSASELTTQQSLPSLSADTLLDAVDTTTHSESLQQQLIFIDTRTPDYEQMLVDLPVGLVDTDFKVVLIDQASDGLAVITSALQRASGVSAVHVISHGSDGSVTLGAVTLDSALLQVRAAEVAGWSAHLTAQADLLIYGCNLAASAQGQALVDKLADLSQRDVAASMDFTGHSVLNGDWQLEYQTGVIEAIVPFSAAFQQAWQYRLDTTTALVAHYEFEEGSGGTSADSSVNNNAGTLSNPGIWTTDAAVGNYALDFTGDTTANYRFTVPDNAALDFGNSDFTISFWMKSSEVPAGSVNVLGQESGGPTGYQFTTDHFADVNFDVRNGFVYVEDVHDGNWQLITGVRDSGLLSIYQNGTLVQTDNVSSNTVNGTFDFMVGATGDNTDDYEGLIDDIRIYSRALSLADINELLGPPNTAPVISGFDAAPLFTENGAAVPVDTDVQVADAELDALNAGAGNYSGATFTLARAAGADINDDISFADGNGLSLVGGSLFVNAQVVASIDNSGGRLSATFTDANGEIPTTEIVNRFMQQVTYAHLSDSPPASVDLQWRIADGNGVSQGHGGEQTANDTITVSVNAKNDAPVLDNSGDTVLAGVLQNSADNFGSSVAQILSVSGIDRVTDPDAGALEGIALLTVNSANGDWQYSINNGLSWQNTNPVATSALLLDTTSLLRFEPNAGYTGLADISFRAWDQSAGVAGDVVNATTGGGESAFSAASETAEIQVYESPEYTINAPSSISVTEDNEMVLSGADVLQVLDGTGGNQVRVSVSVSNGHLTLSTLTGIVLVEGNQGDGRLVLEGLEPDVNAALDGLKYTPSADFSGADSLKVSVGLAGVDAYYPFGIDDRDASDGIDYHGTIEGAAFLTSDPDRGNVLLLSGVPGSQFSVPGTFSGATSITAAAWVDSYSAYSEVISIGGAFNIRIDDPYRSGNVNVFYHNGSQYFHAASNQAIANTGWRHVAATLDNTTGELTLYIDGVIAAQTSGSGSVQYTGNSYIGSNNGSSLFLQGQIDQVYVFNRALSAASIAMLATDSAVYKTTVPIFVSPVNDPPIISGVEGPALPYTENDGALAVTNSIVVTDIDNTHLHSATVKITGNHHPGEDVLVHAAVSGVSGNWDALTGILSFNGVATLSDYQALLRSVSYQNTAEDPSSLSRQIEFTVNDGTIDSAGVTRTVQITPVNDAPLLSSIETSNLSYLENGGSIAITSTIELSDVDNTLVDSAVVRIQPGRYLQGADRLLFSNTANITGHWNDNAGVLTLSGTDTVANYQAALRSVSYENLSENPGNGPVSVVFEVSDQALVSNTQTREIELIEVNDVPVLQALEATSLFYTENENPVAVTDTLAVEDIDDSTLVSASVSIINHYHAGAEQLSFTGAGNISGSWDSVSGVLTLSGIAGKGDYEQALRSVTYEYLEDNPDSAVRTLVFSVNDGKNDSSPVTRQLQVLAVNDAPQMFSGLSGYVPYTENSAPVTIADTAVVSDADDTQLQLAVIQFTAKYQMGEDQLLFTDTANIISSWDAVTGTLILSGVDTVANYQSAVQSVRYQNLSDSPDGSIRPVSLVVSDGTALSNPVLVTLDIVTVNDPPILTGMDSVALSYTENSAAVRIAPNLTVADADHSAIQSAVIEISENFVAGQDRLLFTNTPTITGNWNDANGVLTLTGAESLAAYQTALRDVRYHNVSDAPDTSARKVEFTVNDTQSASVSVSREIEVTAVNDAPVVNRSETVVHEYQAASGAVAVSATIEVSDIDDSEIEFAVVTITSGYHADQDVLRFADTPTISGVWDPTLGVLTLVGTDSVMAYQQALRSVTFENISADPVAGIRSITFSVSDGDFNATHDQRDIWVNELIRPPDLQSIEAFTLPYQENSPAVAVTNQVTLTADAEIIHAASVTISGAYAVGEESLVYSGNGNISSHWDPATGTLSLSGTETAAVYQSVLRAVNYQNSSDNPTTGLREILFSVNDGSQRSNVVSRYIDIIAVNDPPVSQDATIAMIEDGVYTFSESDFGFVDPIEGDAFLALVVESLPDQGRLLLNNSEISSGTEVEAGLLASGALTYDPNPNEHNTAYASFDFRVRDNGGVAVGGVDLSAFTNTLVIDVSSQNDRPVIVTRVLTVDEGASAILDTTVLDGYDADSVNEVDLKFTLRSEPDNGRVVLAGTDLQAGDTFTLADILAGVIRYSHNGSETSEDQIQFALADNDGNPAAAALATLSVIIEEIIDAAPEVEDDSLSLAFAGRFDSSAADLLTSGQATLGGAVVSDSNVLVEIEQMPAFGTLELHSDNTFTYVHNGSSILTDQFTYRAFNEDGIFSIATVTINVQPPMAAALEVGPSTPALTNTTMPDKTVDSEEPMVEPSAAEESPPPELIDPVAFGVSPAERARSESEFVESEPAVVTLEPVPTIGNLVDVVSEKIEVRQHASIEKPITIKTEASALAALFDLEITFNEERFGISNPDFLQGLLTLESNLLEAADDSQRQVQLSNEAMFGVTISATAGIVVWVLRGGALFASMMALTPYWSVLDPARLFNDKKASSEEVERYFETR